MDKWLSEINSVIEEELLMTNTNILHAKEWKYKIAKKSNYINKRNSNTWVFCGFFLTTMQTMHWSVLLPESLRWRKLKREILIGNVRKTSMLLIKSWAYLPGCKARGAHQMPTGLNLDIFIVLSTNFTELKSGTHFTI